MREDARVSAGWQHSGRVSPKREAQQPGGARVGREESWRLVEREERRPGQWRDNVASRLEERRQGPGAGEVVRDTRGGRRRRWCRRPGSRVEVKMKGPGEVVMGLRGAVFGGCLGVYPL